MQAAVSARLQILGFDAGSGTPQSLLVWFFEMLLLPVISSSLICPAPPAPGWYIIAAAEADDEDEYGEYGCPWALWYG